MGYLAKFPTVRNSTAGLVVFFCGYITAAITALVFFNTPGTVLLFIACVLLAALLFMTLVFSVAWSLKRTDLVDVAWGIVFIVIAGVAWLLSEYSVQVGWNIQTIVALLVTVWGLRLAGTLLLRMWGRPEDKRYIELRKKWHGNLLLNTYIRIFATQALLAVVISAAAIIVLASPPQQLGIYAYIGIGVWVIGFCFEVIGDLQLKRFIASPQNKGKVLSTGLWRYTRHPNYFGEATMWWGIFIIALSTYIGWLGVISPVIITFLLLFVSGVPMAEMALSKRNGWKEYTAKTSKFLPLPPKEV